MAREESQERKKCKLLTGFVDVFSLILEFNLKLYTPSQS